jgi:hypothetical protein
VVLDEATSKDPVERQQYYRLTGDLLAGAKYDGAAMNRSRITDDMFACIPALLLEGMAKAEIAAMYSVTPGTLVVLCSQRGISLRRGGTLPKRTKLPKRTNLTLPDEPLPLSDGLLKSLSEAAREMGKDSTARLVSDLLEKIASDGLYKAVLDEEVHNDRASASVGAW